MEKSAIQHLQNSANFDLVFANFAKAKTGNSHTLVPEGFMVKDLEAQMPFRNSYRCSFHTSSVPDYIEYVKGFDNEGSKCFIDADTMSAETVFDLGTVEQPGHQRNKATLRIEKSSAYKSLLSYAGDHLSQKQLSDWIEDWAAHIKVFNDESVAMTIQDAARAVRNITIEKLNKQSSEVGDFSSNMSELEKMNATSTDPLPAFITFSCKPYADLEARDFTLRISIITGGKNPMLSMRIIQLEAIQEEIVEEFKALIVAKLKDAGCKAKAFIGSI